ncbi:MAG: Ig-like domain-containing protein, partial [Bacteroidales bacterium]|nr:Ig-like domain-containing protein [Bacteroidales bacterium]
KYTLRVDPAWPDENGQPLRAEVRKTFTAGPPDAQPVLPKQWVLIPPPARSFQPVILKLAKPHDRFLLERLLRVTDAAGKTVPGQITVGGGERIVTFAPTTAWQPGQYQLIVDTRLEDVCGNRVGEPFEVDIFREITQRIVPEFLMRPFLVK